MIKKINTIATPYTATTPKTNDVSTLDATEWNNISSAVATAHSKINEVAGFIYEQPDGTPTIQSDNTTTPKKDLLIVGSKDLELEGDDHVDIAAENGISIRTATNPVNGQGGSIVVNAHQTFDVTAHNGISLTSATEIGAEAERFTIEAKDGGIELTALNNSGAPREDRGGDTDPDYDWIALNASKIQLMLADPETQVGSGSGRYYETFSIENDHTDGLIGRSDNRLTIQSDNDLTIQSGSGSQSSKILVTDGDITFVIPDGQGSTTTVTLSDICSAVNTVLSQS